MACKWLKHFLIVVIGLFSGTCVDHNHSHNIKCLDNHQCLPLSQCQSSDSDTFLYPCHSGLNMVCCPHGSFLLDRSNKTSIEDRKTSLFPANCGIVTTTDKIVAGKEADLGQFPWMALLGYRQKQVDFTQFLCGGSIITEHYILTAAHCITLDRRLELVLIRLGEHNLVTERDCIREARLIDGELVDGQTCAEPHVDKAIQHITTHPKYDDVKLQNDIALIKVRQRIKFTEFIRPICLPFNRNLEKRDLSKQKLIVSGWGKTDAGNVGGSNILQFTFVTVWNQTACQKNVPPQVKPISEKQLCANGEKKEDACKGDSGGPLVNATVGADAELRYFQIGIVSFASSMTCGNPSLPTVYTRVDKFLQWIEENVS